jgi:proton-dependent oligopeptide transporter, POT family
MSTETESLPRRREASALPWELPRPAQLAIALELCERFGFYSLLSLLALFLSADRSDGGFAWDRTSALALLGVYSGLMYALPVVGGSVADRVLGHRRALIVGGSMMCAGYVLLMSPALLPRVLEALGQPGATERLAAITAPLGTWHVPPGLTAEAAHLYLGVSTAFWAAIVLLVAGNSLFKSTLVVVLGDSLEGDDGLRETAYAYYYTAINVGGLIAGFVAGAVAVTYGWAAAFGTSALAVGVALSAYIALSGDAPRHRPSESTATSATQPASPQRGAGTRLFILAVFAALLLVYSVGSFQLYGVMSLFLEHNVNRHVGSFNMPTEWFTSVDSAALILAAPAFAALWTYLARRGREPDILHKYAIALSLGALGLLLFAAVAWPRPGAAAPGWILPAIGITVQATGEVAAWTASYGLVYRLAPRRWTAAVMGAFYASTLGLGAYLAGWVGRFAQPGVEGRYFLTFGVVTAAAALVALLIGSPLRKLAAASGAALRVRTRDTP